MVAGVRENEDDQLDPRVASTESDAPIEGLPVRYVSLAFDSGLATVSGDDLIPCSRVADISDPDLASPADARGNQCPKAAEKTDLTDIPKLDSARKCPYGQVKPKGSRDPCGEVDREIRHAAVLDSAEMAVRDPDGIRNPVLAQTGQASRVPNIAPELD